jgi:hypothetical protein
MMSQKGAEPRIELQVTIGVVSEAHIIDRSECGCFNS